MPSGTSLFLVSLKSVKELEVKTYHEYQSRTEVLLKEEFSRTLQLPRSLCRWKNHRHQASSQSSSTTSDLQPPPEGQLQVLAEPDHIWTPNVHVRPLPL